MVEIPPAKGAGKNGQAPALSYQHYTIRQGSLQGFVGAKMDLKARAYKPPWSRNLVVPTPLAFSRARMNSR